MTKTIFIKKEIWDLIKIGPQEDLTALWEQKKKIKENWMIVGIVNQIIKESINDNIFNNIIYIIDLYVI